MSGAAGPKDPQRLLVSRGHWRIRRHQVLVLVLIINHLTDLCQWGTFGQLFHHHTGGLLTDLSAIGMFLVREHVALGVLLPVALVVVLVPRGAAAVARNVLKLFLMLGSPGIKLLQVR